MIERTEYEGIVTIRLAHGKASALDVEFAETLARAIAEAGQSDARAVILTGTGSIFSAGVDLFRVVDGGADYVRKFYPALTQLSLDLFALDKPVVAALNGHAIAGGCVLASACDIRLMASGNGRIGIPEMLVGVPFPASILEVLRFAIPTQHLQSLIYTGRTVTADEAFRVGMIDEVVAPEALAARAWEVAQQLAALPADAFRLAKRQLRDKALSRAKKYAHELDREALALWEDAATHARIREYLAKTVKPKATA